jgi:hypothetical protein
VIDKRLMYELWYPRFMNSSNRDEPFGLVTELTVYAANGETYCGFISNRPHMFCGYILEETDDGMIWQREYDTEQANDTVKFSVLTLKRYREYWSDKWNNMYFRTEKEMHVYMHKYYEKEWVGY